LIFKIDHNIFHPHLLQLLTHKQPTLLPHTNFAAGEARLDSYSKNKPKSSENIQVGRGRSIDLHGLKAVSFLFLTGSALNQLTADFILKRQLCSIIQDRADGRKTIIR
jgi:hypothetical protein